MRKLFIVICMLTMIFGTLQAAVVQIDNSAANSLADAITAATAGDMIVLTTEGVYLNDSEISFDKDLTIVGLASLPTRPIVRYNGTSSGSYLMKVTGNPRVVVQYLEFDGDGIADGSGGLSKYVFRLDNGDAAGTMDFFMDNCITHDFADKFIKPYGNCGIDSLVVTNSTFYNGASEGIVLYSGTSSDPAVVYNYAEFTACTFYAIEREAIKGQTGTTGTVVVDRCTFVDCGNVENKSMMYLRELTDITVKNSIFANSQNADAGEEFADLANSSNVFTNNVLWDIVNSEIGNATVTDTMTADPMFANAASGDFTVGNADLYTFADDGGPVGDPVWIPMLGPALIQINNAAPNALANAISIAGDGDVIELISEGVYLNDSEISFDKSLIIRGSDLLPTRPIVRYNGTSSGSYMFKVTGSPRVLVQNIEFDGDGVADGSGGLSKYVFRLDNGDVAGTMDFFMDNCITHDFADKFIKPYGNCGIDSLVVTNSVFYNGASEGIVLYSGTSSDPAVVYNYAEFSNSTFYAIEREAIKGQTGTTGTVVVDRCTFVDCGNVENKSMMYLRELTDITVKNSIFANSQNADSGEEFADLANSSNVFTNNVLWDIVNSEIGNATVTDTMTADPMFADAANADFTVGNAALLTFADDGGMVGDPRWMPAATVVEVTNGAPNALMDAVAAAGPGDVIELVSAGVYTNDGEINIEQDIVIRGSAALPTRPIVKYNGSSSTHMLRGKGSAHISISNLEFDGDGTGEGASGLAKYFFRIDNGDPTNTLDLYIDNVEAHDFTDKIIKAYGNTGIDSVVITNSVFYGGASEGICLYEGSSSAFPTVLNYAEISNCTIYGVEREAIKQELYAGSEVVINRVTIFDCGNVENKPMMRFRNTTDLEVKNSIFANSQNADSGEEFADLGDPADPGIMFHNNAIWDVVNVEVGGATVTDTVHMDPMFADAANADFTIPDTSPLYAYADDGGSIGDTRWAPPLGAYFLSTFVVGGGSVTLDPPGGVYAEDQVVTLTAVPDEYYQFDHWDPSIVYPPNNPIATVTMTESRGITAHFTPVFTVRDIQIASVGYGHVDETHLHKYAGITDYVDEDTLKLTAVADSANWEFAYWVDAAMDSIADGDIDSVITEDASFIAYFRSTMDQVSLDLTVVGMGDVDINPMPVPGFTTYNVGTEVTLKADAAIGLEFGGWSGGLTSAEDSVTVTLNADLALTATFTEIALPNGVLAIGPGWDLLDALEFTANNSLVNTIMLSDVGPYVADEARRSEGKIPQLDIEQKVAIVGDPSLSEKPLIQGYTSSTGGSSSEGFFRLRMGADLKLENLRVDGWMDGATVSAKYLFRADDSDNFGYHASLTAIGVDFNSTIEAFYKNYPSVIMDTLRFIDCMVEDIGKEGIFLNSVGEVDYLEVSNSTFNNVGREVLYLKTLVPSQVILDHLTIVNSGYGYGTEGAKFAAVKAEATNNVSFTNSIIENVPNTTYDYAVRLAGDNSFMSNILLHMSSEVLDLQDDAVAGPDVFWYDPMLVDAVGGDYTLADASVAYHMSDMGGAIGDLRWATSTNITDYKALNLTLEGPGIVSLSPEPMAKFYTPGTAVTLTARPDTAYGFIGWTGDMDEPLNAILNVTMTTDLNLTANFAHSAVGIQDVLPTAYSLSQNYPNPFNPSTTISFDLVDAAQTRLILYDVRGRQLEQLVNENMNPGRYTVTFDGSTYASGIYFYRLVSGEFTAVKKLMLLK